MKKLLILVLSSDFYPYNRLMETSMETWDSVDVEGVETIFYCAQSAKESTNKIIYLPVEHDLYNIGRKTLLSLEWALNNKEFDYIARPNANCYVRKQKLFDHVQGLPKSGVFTTLEVTSPPVWGWGGGQAIISRDVVEAIVNNKHAWNHMHMEDMAMSQLVLKLGYKFTPAIACSIDRLIGNWRCMSYGGPDSFEFTNFDEIVRAEDHFFFRTKQDYDREKDMEIMRELFKYLR